MESSSKSEIATGGSSDHDVDASRHTGTDTSVRAQRLASTPRSKQRARLPATLSLPSLDGRPEPLHVREANARAERRTRRAAARDTVNAAAAEEVSERVAFARSALGAAAGACAWRAHETLQTNSAL